MLHFKNPRWPHFVPVPTICTYHLPEWFACCISAFHLPGVSKMVANTLSRSWLVLSLELCPGATFPFTDFEPFPAVQTRSP